MNWLNFKGVQSTEIEGLLICELPPISKPALRVKETTIDGIDGSIIDELGYSSYDKKVEIGLRGNYDIDKVIQFFNGEGNVVFSNEPDKFYKAKIIGKIDFARLVRFRKASVTFKVQPFKYKRFESAKTLVSSPAEVFNAGFEPSKPKITLKGSGSVSLSVNGVYVFDYTFPTGETEVIIDSELQDAHFENELKNRFMNGEFPIFNPGTNIIEWTGDVESITVLARSRWL